MTAQVVVHRGGRLPPPVRTVNPRSGCGRNAPLLTGRRRRGPRTAGRRPRLRVPLHGEAEAAPPGSSIASSVPSSAHAAGDVAGVVEHRLVVVARRVDLLVADQPAPAACRATVRTGCAPKASPGRASARRGRPGRACAARGCRRPWTAITCMPRQMPSTGSPTAVAPRPGRAPRRRGRAAAACRSGAASAPYRPGSTSAPPVRTSPSRRASTARGQVRRRHGAWRHEQRDGPRRGSTCRGVVVGQQRARLVAQTPQEACST